MFSGARIPVINYIELCSKESLICKSQNNAKQIKQLHEISMGNHMDLSVIWE